MGFFRFFRNLLGAIQDDFAVAARRSIPSIVLIRDHGSFPRGCRTVCSTKLANGSHPLRPFVPCGFEFDAEDAAQHPGKAKQKRGDLINDQD
jgi:hypothetical protein